MQQQLQQLLQLVVAPLVQQIPLLKGPTGPYTSATYLY